MLRHQTVTRDSLSATDSSRKVRTLIVDDSESFRLAVSEVLEVEELANVTGFADNGAEAIQLAATTTPELVLMDVTMPVMDGLEAAAILKRLLPVTKVILMSGEETYEMQERALATGADGFFFKTAFPEDFVCLLSQIFPQISVQS